MNNRKQNRKLGFDYTTEAFYFLTICCKDKTHHFGEIIDNEMILNEYGKISNNRIKWLEQQYPYFVLHNYIIMPNHIHILAEINTVGTGRDLSNSEHDINDQNVNADRTNLSNSEHDIIDQNHNKIRTELNKMGNNGRGRKIKSISELMGAFKTTTSKEIHLAGNNSFLWQRSFHDHIIRNNNVYDQISDYITQNPVKWEEDTFNKNITEID